MGYIYLITNTINNHKYIGQTISYDINKRWNNYKKLNKNSIGYYFYNALIKYKLENFKFQIICICFDNDCNKFEEYYINYYNTIVPNGYNLRSGGLNSKQHPETIEKRRISNLGKKRTEDKIYRSERHHMFGKTISDEQKLKLSISFTLERKNIQSKIMKERWKNKLIIKETINYSGLILGYEKIKKKVEQYSIDLVLIKSYESIQEAAIQNGYCRSTIGKCCNNSPHYKTHKGYIWKFTK